MNRRTGYQTWLLAGALVLGVAAGGSGTAVAQQAPTPPAQRQPLLTPDDRAAMGQIFWHRMQEQLGLSDQQVSDIRTLLQNQRDASRTDVQALIAAQRQFRTLLQQPTAAPDAIQSAAAQAKSLRDQLFDRRLQTQLAIRSKLTPDQLAKWAEMRKGMGHGGWRRGGGFGWGRS
jgi:Spy/CpxP family protein refolding chaperone